MAEQYVSILGQRWTLDVCPEEKYDFLSEFCDGSCDNTIRRMVVCDYSSQKPDPLNKQNLEQQSNKNVRHEMIHAFLFESGLAENSSWAQSEEMVDWFAIQFPKLMEAMKQVGSL